MNGNAVNHISLNDIRLSEGALECRAVFNETVGSNKMKAAALLNGSSFKFPCFFLLRPDIESLGLKNLLNMRNKTALEIAGYILGGEPGDVKRLTGKNEAEYSALKWILTTGYGEEALGGDYDRILDVAVSVLINIYRDLSSLPLVSDMIFNRSKRGRNIHDLVWAYFRIRDPYALKLIAQRLRSSDPHDYEFALFLLDKGTAAGADSQYASFLQWLKENDPFLYFTDDSFQATSYPKFFSVDRERKYLHKGIPGYDMQPALPANSIENKSLEVFKTQSDEDKTVLSDYSQKLRKESVSEWKKWMRYPADIQIKTAKGEREAVNDQNN